MVKRSGRKQKRRTRDKETLVSITAETQRVTIEERQRYYRDNTSERLIDIYDPDLERMRVETDEERRNRVLGHTMEVKAYVGKTTSIRAREINEMNATQPIKSTPIPSRKSPPISTQKQMQHPLWRNPSLLPLPRSLRGHALVTDKFGFHDDIVKDICTKTKGRYFTDTEKVFLTTQVNLMLSLSHINRNNQLLCVKNVCKRMGIISPDTPDREYWSQLSTNIRKWSAKFEIRPIWEGTDAPNSITALDDEARKYLKEDFDLFTSYSFTLKDSAALANAIHGTNRASNTISEWEADGTPRDRNGFTDGTEKKPMSTIKEKPVPTEVVEKDTQVSSIPERTFYPTDAKYWVTSKGEPCKDCGNSHCQDNLVDIPSVMVKMILAIKDGALDWRQLVWDDVRREMASETEDEAKVLGLELHQVKQELASVMTENQNLAKQLEVVEYATTEKEKEIKDLLS